MSQPIPSRPDFTCHRIPSFQLAPACVNGLARFAIPGIQFKDDWHKDAHFLWLRGLHLKTPKASQLQLSIHSRNSDYFVLTPAPPELIAQWENQIPNPHRTHPTS